MDEIRPAVALTIWDDQTLRINEPWTVDPTVFRDVSKWAHRNGNRDRIRNIRFGLDRCAGWLQLRWIKATDSRIKPRQILGRRDKPERRGLMAETDFDLATEEFLIELHKA